MSTTALVDLPPPPPKGRRVRGAPTVTFVDGYAVGFRMAVPECFKSAFDILQTPRKVDGLETWQWTEGIPPCYSFGAGDTVYDTPLAYVGTWGEALKHIDYAIVIAEAYPDEPSGTGKRDGYVRVEFYQPNAMRGRLVAIGRERMTQTELVALLRNGR